MKKNFSFIIVDNKVRAWLMCGVVIVLIQIMLGGITRLTGSGLSITKWDIITGSIPPLSEQDWSIEFDLYKMSPQYKKINSDFLLSDFKFIFFWEYFHRLWARMIGLIFLFPLIYFMSKGMLPRSILRKLVLIFLAGILAGILGWIMVKSGLNERPWVNAYKLTIHLSSACVVLILLWDLYLSTKVQNCIVASKSYLNWLKLFFVLIASQILLGAIMSGSKAALLYPTWPTMHGEFVPKFLLQKESWNALFFLQYDTHPLVVILVQFLHRNLAYTITVLFCVFLFISFKNKVDSHLVRANLYIGGHLLIQAILGILTLLFSVGSIPLFFGVMHQIVGIGLLMNVYFWIYKSTSS